MLSASFHIGTGNRRRQKMKFFLVIFCAVQAFFCTALPQDIEVDDVGSGQPTPTREPKLSKIVFSKDWKETLHGALEPGELVYIEYHASRLPNRDTRYGQRAWNIFAEVQYSVGGKVHSAIMKGPDKDGNMKTVLEIPVDAKDFIIWFKHHGYYNGYSYDSNFGENYRFSFTQIVFTGDWREYVVGSLRPGEKFQVVYDSIRLPWRDIGYLGMGYAWNIFAHAQFSDNGPVIQQMLQGGNQGGNPIMTTIYDIPKNAQKVVMWFYFSGYRHHQKWDSNHNQNYHFSLSTK